MDLIYRPIDSKIMKNALDRLRENGYEIDDLKRIEYDANESSQFLVTRVSKDGESFNALIKVRDTEESLKNRGDDICSIGEMNRILPGSSPEVVAVDFSRSSKYYSPSRLNTTITVLKIPDGSMILREYLKKVFDRSIKPANTRVLGEIVRNGINLIKKMESVNSNSVRPENLLINPRDLSLSLWNFDLSCCIKNYEKDGSTIAGSSCCYDKSNTAELNACLMKHDKKAKGVTSPLYIWGTFQGKSYNSFEDGKKNDLFAFLAILHYWAFDKYPFIENIASFPHFYDLDPIRDFWFVSESGSVSAAELATNPYKKIPNKSNFTKWCLNKFKMENSSERIIFPQQIFIQKAILLFINNMFKSFDEIFDLVKIEINNFIDLSGEYKRIFDLSNITELENRISFLLKLPFKLIRSDDISLGSQGLTSIATLNGKEIIAKIYAPRSTNFNFDINEKANLFKLNIYEKENKITIGPVIYNSIKLKTISGRYRINLMQKIKPSFVELEKLIRESRASDLLIKELIQELLQKVEHLHKAKIFHKDLKGDNILVNISKPSGHRIRIIDFALSCCMDDDEEDDDIGCHLTYKSLRSCMANVSAIKLNLSPLNMLHELENKMTDFKTEDLGKHNDMASLLSLFYFMINYQDDGNYKYSETFTIGPLSYPLVFADSGDRIYTNPLFKRFKKDPSNTSLDIQTRFKERFSKHYIKSNKDNTLKRPELDRIIDNMFEYYYNNLYENPDTITENFMRMIR